MIGCSWVRFSVFIYCWTTNISRFTSHNMSEQTAVASSVEPIIEIENIQNNDSSVSDRANPAIIRYGFKDFSKTKDNNGVLKTSAICTLCGKTKTETGSTTTNYRRHFKTNHKES